jgi:hypothetical protein
MQHPPGTACNVQPLPFVMPLRRRAACNSATGHVARGYATADWACSAVPCSTRSAGQGLLGRRAGLCVPVGVVDHVRPSLVAPPVRRRLHAALVCCMLHVACCNVACGTLHAATLHATRCMLQRCMRQPCMLHVACGTLHAARCMLHVACGTLHAARCMLHVACCNVACGTLHLLQRCMLHVACGTLHAARCMLRVTAVGVSKPLALANLVSLAGFGQFGARGGAYLFEYQATPPGTRLHHVSKQPLTWNSHYVVCI